MRETRIKRAKRSFFDFVIVKNTSVDSTLSLTEVTSFEYWKDFFISNWGSYFLLFFAIR